ncbi:hypothetical protein D0Y65_017070 [Glycine soja]|uniref:Uncharacterized protein n=1 Tax=Glycine soja TaxID=3848 RepID=A0A445JT77_GLYSO|nr:hypothetical protein D0Y65_017070 [Glycine soja]
MLGFLRREVNVSGLNSQVEGQTKELEGLNEKLCTCKEQAKIETALKNESISDLDIDEEEVLKLAALGKGPTERVQELETLTEAKENEYLRSVKLSKITKTSKNLEESIKSDSDTLTACKLSSKEQSNRILTPKSGIDLTANDNKGTNALQGCSKHNYKDQDRDDIAFSKPSLVKLEPVSGIKTEKSLQGKCTLAASPRVDIDIGIDMANISAGAMDEDVTLQTNIKQPVVNITKELPLTLSNSAAAQVTNSEYEDGTFWDGGNHIPGANDLHAGSNEMLDRLEKATEKRKRRQARQLFQIF